ncbi:MAG TPA: cytidylate kinase-like family protein [Solirubrobacteraceae bacterium]|nr:cytidylate kinase-like family protein [Solirubrobacteraceae bacterium]
MAFTAICISSHDGTGAHGAARLVASTLDYRLIDEDIITRAAVEAGVDEEVVADVERRKSRLVRLIEGLGPAGMAAGYAVPLGDAVGYGQPASDELRGLIRSVIEETAASGGVVIVSHAASMALAHRDDVLRVLVTASVPTRERRVASSNGIDEKEAARAIKRSDAGRADYLQRFYGVDAEMPTHYDVVLNTDRLSPEHVAELVIRAAGVSPAAQGTAA